MKRQFAAHFLGFDAAVYTEVGRCEGPYRAGGSFILCAIYKALELGHYWRENCTAPPMPPAWPMQMRHWKGFIRRLCSLPKYGLADLTLLCMTRAKRCRGTKIWNARWAALFVLLTRTVPGNVRPMRIPMVSCTSVSPRRWIYRNVRNGT